MPPPPLVFHNDTPPDNYLATETQFIPNWVPGTRQIAQPIPIEQINQITASQSYSLGSQETTMSEISDSLRPSPPPLTATSDLPTPYTIRTPAATASASTARPILINPITPTSVETEMEENNGELVRVKSDPNSGEMMRDLNEGSNSGGPSRRSTPAPAEIESQDVEMGIEEAENFPDEEALSSSTENGNEPSSSAPQASLTRLLRDIGNPPSPSDAPPRFPPYLQPFMDQRAVIFGTRWSQPVPTSSGETPVQPYASSSQQADPENHQTHAAHATGEPHQEITSPYFNELGPLPRVDGAEQQSQPWRHENLLSQLSYHQPTASFPRIYNANLLGGWGEAYTSHPITVSDEHHRASSSGREQAQPSRIAPIHLQIPPSTSSISGDFRSLPSPVNNSSAGSPSSVERRLDTIEARLDRARGRGQRSPPTPPAIAPLHTYEGLRARNNASRPYDLSSRSRPSSQTVEDGTRRLSYTRPSVRPSWLESSSSSSTATVPPPRSRPATTFGWTTADTHAHPYDGPSLTDWRTTLRNPDEQLSPASPDQTTQQQYARSRYLQARLNMLDNLRTGPNRAPSPNPPFAPAIWANMPTQDRPDFPLGIRAYSQDARNHVEGFTNYNQPNLLGDPPGVRPREINNTSHTTDDLPVRPGNRRWLSVDEGERDSRDSSRARDDTRTQVPQDPIGSLNRDVNEAVGRRLSQPRQRSASISRLLRNRLGPDWEDTRVSDFANSTTPNTEPSSGPTQATEFAVDPPGETEDANARTDRLPFFPPGIRPRYSSDMYLGGSQGQDRIRDRSNTTSPADELAELLERRRRDRPNLGVVGSEEAELTFLERLRSNNQAGQNGLIRIGELGDLMQIRNQDGFEGIMDISNESPFSYAYYNQFRRLNHPITQHHHHHHYSFSNLKITNEMDEKEKLKIVQIVIRSINRLPNESRLKAAESTLNKINYNNFNNVENVKCVEGMEKDEYCSVCHDDYEEQSEITITPCKHMYHKGCLDTWLHTPNTSSCPMCRRDLAALAYLTKLVPSKNLDDALPLWMAVVV